MPNAKPPRGPRRVTTKPPKPAGAPAGPPPLPAAGDTSADDTAPFPFSAVADATPLPRIVTANAPVGRATLASVRDELRASPWPRAPMRTIGYDDVPLDASGGSFVSPSLELPSVETTLARAFEGAPRPIVPASSVPPDADGMRTAPDLDDAVTLLALRPARPSAIVPATSPFDTDTSLAPARSVDTAGVAPVAEPRRAPARPLMATPPLSPPRSVQTSAPEIMIGNPGRPPVDQDDPPAPGDGWGSDVTQSPPFDREAAPARCEALELFSFVVPQTVLTPRAGDDEKRRFVGTRFGHRLPCAPERIRRIDMRVIEPGAVLLRVWCPVE